jgi:4-hydroxybenzoate polyprenyltransferase
MTIATITMNRWVIYQRERFPLLAHGLLIAAFSGSAVSFSFLLRTETGLPSLTGFAAAFATSLLIFLQLRIADEFKDFDEDAKYRPYRPVPRGLVSLRQLAVIGIVAAVVQLTLALLLKPSLIFLLLVVWAYLGLMSREFFVREWIVDRPITYLWTHMLIMPLVDLYATACDWHAAGSTQPNGLLWFLVVSFFNGVVIEFGRKIRCPEDEEHGVRTYSALYGCRRATIAWLCALGLAGYCAWRAAANIDYELPLAITLGLLLAICLGMAIRFLREPNSVNARWIEHASGVWTLAVYLSLGIIPLIIRIWN